MEAPCPTADSLVSWVLGDLPDHEATAVLDHLDTCPVCEQFVAQAEASQTLPGFNTDNDFQTEQQCQALVGRLGSTRPVATTAASHTEDLSGDQIRDYQLIRQLGRGGMGVVYLARHLRLNKLVAIKLVPGQVHDDPAAVARFEREMQAVGQLDHPNVVRALDAGDAGDVSFLTMELIEGCDLSKLLKGGRRLELPDAAEIVRQAAEGLLYAHQQGLIHRDVKPSNLMLSRESDGCVRVRVLDLGLAMMPESRRLESMLTDQNLLIGTLQYMAPEQAENMHTVDHRADIYALGATLYRLLTGQPPFSGPEYRTPANRLIALITKDAPRLNTSCPDAPQAVVELVDRMLSRDCTVRPESMAEVAAVLSPYASADGLAVLLRELPVGLNPQELTLPETNPLPVNAPDHLPATGVRISAKPRPSSVQINTPRAGAGGRRGRAVCFALAVAIPLSVLAALIWIQTDGGYIQVEHDDDIQLTLQVMKDGMPHGEFELQHSDQTVFYRTGEYEFQLPRSAGDTVQIQNGNFRLQRNDRQVVKITHVADRQDNIQNDAVKLPVSATGTAALSSQELAAWVIARKGTVLSDAGELTQLSHIPDGPFTISSVSIQKANADDIRRLADFVQHMPSCVRLSLLLGEFTDDNVIELARLKHLETLVVGSPAMTDQRLATIVGPALKMLTIFKAAVTSQGLRSVQQQCPNLKVLHVGSAVLQDVRPIADMTQLTVLQINVSGPSSAPDLLEPLQKSHVTDLTVKGKWHPEFAEVISLMPALQELHLQDCKALTDNALLQISTSSSLRTVRVTGPHRLSVAAVKSLRQQATNQEISVEGLVF